MAEVMRAENVLAVQVQEAQCDGEAAARSAYQEGRVRRAEGVALWLLVGSGIILV